MMPDGHRSPALMRGFLFCLTGVFAKLIAAFLQV
jgi:hypothetical protein